MEYPFPTARDAWVNDKAIRRWFEIVIDAESAPHQHRAYICKCCWRKFYANQRLLDIEYHIETHERRGDLPYSSQCPSQILTGEQVMEINKQLLERFDTIIPEAGTWKFQCKACLRRFLHRSDYRELLEHYDSCRASKATGPIQ